MNTPSKQASCPNKAVLVAFSFGCGPCDVNMRDRFFYMRAVRAIAVLASGIQCSDFLTTV